MICGMCLDKQDVHTHTHIQTHIYKHTYIHVHTCILGEAYIYSMSVFYYSAQGDRLHAAQDSSKTAL